MQNQSGRGQAHNGRAVQRPFLSVLTGIGTALRIMRDFPPHVVGLLLRAYLAYTFVMLELHRPADWPTIPMLLDQHFGVADWLPAMATELAGATNIVFAICLLLGTCCALASTVLLVLNCLPWFLYTDLWTLPRISALQQALFWSSYLLFLIACGPGRLSMSAFMRRRREDNQG